MKRPERTVILDDKDRDLQLVWEADPKKRRKGVYYVGPQRLKTESAIVTVWAPLRTEEEYIQWMKNLANAAAQFLYKCNATPIFPEEKEHEQEVVFLEDREKDLMLVWRKIAGNKGKYFLGPFKEERNGNAVLEWRLLFDEPGYDHYDECVKKAEEGNRLFREAACEEGK